MKNKAFKKIILLMGAILLISGVSLFAYWMSGIINPPAKDVDVTVIVGVGDADAALIEIKLIEFEDFHFVPAEREDHDSVHEDSKSSFVFQTNISWQPLDELIFTEDRVGVLQAILEYYNFYELNSEGEFVEVETELTQEELDELMSHFKIELGKKENDEFVPLDNVIVNPYESGKQDTHYDEVYIKITFETEPSNIDIRNYLINKRFDIVISIAVDRVIDKP